MDPERVQEQATEALEFVQTVHEILPAWVQVGGLVLIGLACIGGAYALWRLFAARREEKRREMEREEVRLARLAVLAEVGDDQPCSYCALGEHVPYWGWADWLADVRDIGVPLEHILRKCKGAVPPTPLEVLEARIEERVKEERARLSQAKTVKLPVTRVYRGGSNPCEPCRRVV